MEEDEQEGGRSVMKGEEGGEKEKRKGEEEEGRGKGSKKK